MLLIVAAIALVLSVPLGGGRLSRLADLRLRAPWTVLASAAIQVGITTVRDGSYAAHVTLHVLSYLLVAYFLFANRRLTGLPVVALGTGLNLLAIGLNGGVMPASPTALRLAGITPAAGFDNSVARAHEHLRLLGDIIPVPVPLSLGNVLSVGDLIIFAGAFVALHCICGSRLRRGRPADALA
jgi:hypothetical protein